MWADFVRDKRQRCSQGRTKGKGQRDTQRSLKTGRDRNSEKDRDTHRRSETERSTEVETSRDTERQRHTETETLPTSFACLTRTGLLRVYQLQLPKEVLEVLRACWWAKSLTAQRQEPVAGYGCQGPAESPSTWKAASRFITYKRASDS